MHKKNTDVSRMMKNKLYSTVHKQYCTHTWQTLQYFQRYTGSDSTGSAPTTLA